MKVILALLGAWLSVSALASGLLEPQVLNNQVLSKYESWDFAQSKEGKPWFAYYGADNLLYVHRPDGSEVALGATDRRIMQSGLAMTAVDDGMAVLWRDKMPRKHLYLSPKLTATGDAPQPVVVGGEESEPLTRLKMTQVGDVKYLLWLGEKGDAATKEKFHLYFRAIEQEGKVLSPVEQVMPGRYPAWIVDGESIPVFSWMAIDGKLAMAMRVYDRTKKSFSPLVKIADAPPISPVFEAFRSGNRWFLLWLGHYGDGSEMLLEGIYSDDKGQTWKRFAFEALRKLDMGGVSIATDHKNHIVITLDGSRRLLDPDDVKSNVYVIRSEDNGTTWQQPQSMRPDDVRLTKAQYPMVAMGGQPGTVMLAWEDWRNIRPNVYISYSKDYGKTWELPLPLGKPGVWNLGLDPLPRVIFSEGDRFSLVAKQFKDDSLQEQKDYVLYRFTWDEARQNVEAFNLPELQADATEARLRDRATQYWQAMKDGQYETTYAFQDPFFRYKRNLKTYVSNMGRIQYHRIEVKQVARRANLAKVEVEVESSVPEFTTPSGKPVSQPRKVMKFVETWVYVNGDWFHEFYDGLAERGFTNY